ncbi:aminomethyltransferase [Clostridia bacterium]|nr:aminomethyltransferase [Clostridia bacterium]
MARELALNPQHVALEALMADYGGCLSPIQYGGILTENLAVRHGAGLFDMSSNALVGISGHRAFDFLTALSATDVSPLRDGQACQAVLCDKDGGVIDSFRTYPLLGGVVCVISPITAPETLNYLKTEAAERDLELRFAERNADQVLLEFHGPSSKEILRKLKAHSSLLYAQPDTTGTWMIAGTPIAVAASRALRVKGFELFVPRLSAPSIWLQLLRGGATPCGLAAYETLRIEAGQFKFGSELTRDVPFSSARERIIGLKSDIKGIFTAGQAVYAGGVQRGVITSGTTSPALSGSVAMALMEPGAKAPFEVGYRTKRRPVEQAEIPFV